MSPFTSLLVWNVLGSALLAIVVGLLGRWAVLQRRPALLHLLWFGVLLRLVAPPFVPVPIVPDTSVKLRLEADFTQVLPQNISVDVVPVAAPDPLPVATPAESSAPSSWSMVALLFLAASLAGTVVLAASCLFRSLRLYRILSQAEPAPQSLIDQATDLAGEFGFKRCPAVRVVDELATPALWVGGRQATILLPRHLLDELDKEQWSFALAHELAHLARKDHRYNLIAVGVWFLFWWNPVAWWAWRELRACQEACCDAWALSRGTASRRRYAETLLQVVESCSRCVRMPPQGVLGFGNQTIMTRRFQMIANPSVRPRSTPLISGSVAMLVLTFFCVPVRAEKEAPASSSQPVVIAQAPKKDSPRSPGVVTLKYDDDQPDGKRSIAGTGLMIHFEKPEAPYQLKSLKLHCARYGMPAPPKEDIKFSILSEDESQVLHTELVPYAKFQRGESEWTTIGFKKPVEVPDKFWIVIEFNAERTKGVYLSYDTSTEGKHSKTGLPGQESKAVTTGGDWMIQAVLTAAKP